MNNLSKKWINERRMADSISNLRQILWDISSWLSTYVKVSKEDLANAGVYKGVEGADRSKTDPARNQSSHA